MDQEQKREAQALVSQRVLLVEIRKTLSEQFDALIKEMIAFNQKYERIISSPGNDDLREKQGRLQSIIDDIAESCYKADKAICEITDALARKGITTFDP